MLENIDKPNEKVFQPEMDDGGRCLLDVINDPQLLSFLDNSNTLTNNRKDEPTNPSSDSTKLEKVPIVKQEIKAKKSIVATKSTPVLNISNELNNGRQASFVASGNTLPSGIMVDNKQAVSVGAGHVGMMPLSLAGSLPVSAQSLGIQQSFSSLHSSAALTSNSSTLRASTPTVFPQTQFQIGPRSMTVLPQQLMLPGVPMAQPGGISQILLASRPPNPATSLQTGQVLQIIQTSQGTQILPANTPTSIQPVLTTTTTPSSKPSSTNARSNKQILPKPQNSSASSSSTASKSNTSQASSIKLISQQSAAFNSQPINTNANMTSTQQFVIGSGHQAPGIITAPQGTFLLNNVLSNIGSQQFLIQGNVQNPVQLAIRPQAPLFVNNNSLTSDQANLSIALSNNAQVPASKPQSQPTQPQAFVFSNPSAIPVSSSNNLLMAPSIRPNAPNIIIRPQFIGAQQPAQPQLLQIQTPNGPLLVALNSSPQMGPPTILGAQAQPNIQPSTIQIGNTVISLAANNSMNLQPSANPLQTILAPPQDNSAITNANVLQSSIPTSINTSTPLLINSPSPMLTKNQTLVSPSRNIQVSDRQSPKTSSSKGLNLADLLKETGILSDFSPPTSPKNSVTTELNQQPLATSIEPAQQLTNQNSQSTVLMVPGGLNASQNLILPQNSVAPQLRFSLASDGTLVLLQPSANTAQASQVGLPTNLLSTSESVNSLKDTSGIGSSQPSPDSTTPSIDTTATSSPSTSIPQSVAPLVNLSTSDSKPIQSLSNAFDSALNDNSSFKFVYDKPVTSSAVFDTNRNQLIVKSSPSVCEQTQTSVSLSGPLANYPTLSLAPTLSVLTTRNTSSCDTSNVATSCTDNISLVTLNPSASQNLKPPSDPVNFVPGGNAIFSSIVQPNSSVTIADSSGVHLCQTSANDTEFMNRLDTQMKVLQSLKFTTQSQKELMIELKNIRDKLLQPRTIENIALNVQINLSPQAQQILQLSKTAPNHQSLAIGPNLTGNIILTNNAASKDNNNLKILINPNQLNQNTIQLVGSPLINAPLGLIPHSITSDPASNNSPMTKTTVNSLLQAKDAASTKLLPQARIEPDKRPTVLKAIQQQCNADQNAAIHPDCRTPFKSRDDACKRLLRYHVFDSPAWTTKEIDKFDQLYEEVSAILLHKKSQLHNKFNYLLLKQSMKESPVCENVMLDRVFTHEESSSLKSDREFVASGNVLNLPPLPDTWLRVQKEKEELNLKRKLSNDFDDEFEHNEVGKEEIADICNMLEEERAPSFNNDLTCNQNMISNLLPDNSHLNPAGRNKDIDSVDELIDQLNSQHDDASSSGQHLLTTDHQSFLDSLDNVPLNPTNFIDANSNSLNMVTDDLDLEDLYTDINSGNQLAQASSNLHWSSNLNCAPVSNTLHPNNISNNSNEEAGSRMAWSGSGFCGTETEADAAVQSIIGNTNEDTSLSVDLTGIDELDGNIGGENSVNFDDVVQGEDDESSFLDSDPLAQQQQGFDVQMHCAIKSIMMQSPTGMNSVSGASQSSSHFSSSQSYQYMSTSMNSSSNFNSHSYMSTNMRSNNMMPSYQSSVNDTMLDEAVKSILS